MIQVNTAAQHWGIWMFHSTWQTAIVAVLVLIGIRLGRRRLSSQVQYGFMLIVLAKFAMPPFIHSPAGVFSLPSIQGVTARTTSAVRHWNFKQPHHEDVQAVNLSQTPSHDSPQQSGESFLGPNMQAVVESTFAPIDQVTRENSNRPRLMASFPWLTCLAFLYFVGVAVQVTRLIIGFRNVRGLVSRSKRQEGEEARNQMSRLALRLGLRRSPELKRTSESDVPFATGVLHPVVVIPDSLDERLSNEQLSVVMAHELV
ncbi:MAG: M56 family metallopeptidase, partial [Planctomycetota bacterium]